MNEYALDVDNQVIGTIKIILRLFVGRKASKICASLHAIKIIQSTSI